MALPYLNYQHLYYFRKIAHEGGVTRAAESLGLSQSTLSAQLKDLESSFDVKLFRREGRSLQLTEAGKVALDYAEEIFDTGDELRSWLARGETSTRRRIQIGTTSTLSKILQYELLHPLVMASRGQPKVIEAEMPDLIHKLQIHHLDVAFTNTPPGELRNQNLDVHLIGETPVYLVGRPPFRIPKKPFPKWLVDIPLFLPVSPTSARMDFDSKMIRAGIRPLIQAEVDDTALLRMLALSGAGLSLLPEIGVQFEASERKLLRIEKIPGIQERIYAITTHRKQLPSIVSDVIESAQDALKRANTKMKQTKR